MYFTCTCTHAYVGNLYDYLSTVATLCLVYHVTIMWQSCDKNRNYARVSVALSNSSNFLSVVHLNENKVATALRLPLATDLNLNPHGNSCTSNMKRQCKPSKDISSAGQQSWPETIARKCITTKKISHDRWHSSFTSGKKQTSVEEFMTGSDLCLHYNYRQFRWSFSAIYTWLHNVYTHTYTYL